MATLTTVRHQGSAEELVPATLTEQEYLHRTFRPDCDFLDGRTEERNVGEFEHSRVQHILDRIFGNHERERHVFTAPECRLQAASGRYRVPDVMVLRRGQKFTRIICE